MARLEADWIHLAAGLAAAHGLFLAAALFAQRRNRTANALLGALMVSFSVFLGAGVVQVTRLIQSLPHFFGVAFQMPWLFGPLTYLYAVAASDRTWRVTRAAWWHFVPFAISTIGGLPYYLLGGDEKLALLARFEAGDVPGRIVVLDLLKFVSGLAYSFVTVRFLRQHARRVEDSYSDTSRVNLRWLWWLAGASLATWVLASVAGTAAFGARFREEHVGLAVAIVVYAIGYRGMWQPEVFRYETAEFEVVAAAAATPRYDRSSLSEEEAERLKRELLALMEREQPWRTSELTLADLAAQLGVTSHKLSEVLNTSVGQSFYDFVNGYRVREVQRRIRAGDARRLKMLAIALDAGFASKSTFNDAFKKHTALTPSAFGKLVDEESAKAAS